MQVCIRCQTFIQPAIIPVNLHETISGLFSDLSCILNEFWNWSILYTVLYNTMMEATSSVTVCYTHSFTKYSVVVAWHSRSDASTVYHTLSWHATLCENVHFESRALGDFTRINCLIYTEKNRCVCVCFAKLWFIYKKKNCYLWFFIFTVTLCHTNSYNSMSIQ